jgi:hypothetical protein
MNCHQAQLSTNEHKLYDICWLNTAVSANHVASNKQHIVLLLINIIALSVFTVRNILSIFVATEKPHKSDSVMFT